MTSVREEVTGAKLTRAGRVHFIGIGGAGMSAIAKVLIEQGVEVSGSDLKRSRAAVALEAMGARVHLGHAPSHVEGAGIVVVSSAIHEGNAELQAARRAGVTIMTRGEALAHLLAGRRSIVVAGTHGKTTTTSMIVTVLASAGIDATYLVGAGINESGTNARYGTSDIAVAESDESDGSFLLLSPHVAVVTNLEMDHVDFWRSQRDLEDAFERFMAATDEDGVIVVPGGGPLSRMAAHSSRRTVTFGEDGDVRIGALRPSPAGAAFTLMCGGQQADVSLPVPGRHNATNALAAAAASLVVGIPLEEVAAGLSSYRGVERRFQMRGERSGVVVVDDYAHHPTEVKATLQAARSAGFKRVLAVFQPHRYSRTAALAPDFGPAFEDADRIVVTEVYGAGEDPVPGVSGKLVADAVTSALPGRPVAYLPHRDELIAYVASRARAGDGILTLGAGDITAAADEILDHLEGRA
ncbi:MAG TPA: UDP-N-acetylmuramate--L-alanine ligase [Actinomycetota bacterium]|nr:UDP-N-acetylmuramate--L-alanine ligase [Actinomycetota bacterium]